MFQGSVGVFLGNSKVTIPNVAPGKRPLEKEKPIDNHHFQGRTVRFRKGNNPNIEKVLQVQNFG